jgi:hypothetical protein
MLPLATILVHLLGALPAQGLGALPAQGLGALPAQEPPRFQPPPEREKGAVPAPSPLVPGALPKDAAPDAVAAWQRACRAMVAPGSTGRRAAAFDLQFDMRLRDLEGPGRNEAVLRFRYLDAQRYVRSSLQSGREHVLGPKGPWLIDGKQRIQLADTRENQDDLRQIEETIAIARNFLALTDPSALRIAALARLDRPPQTVPAPLAARAERLVWLDVQSPDFRLLRAEGPRADGLYRVRLGTHPETGRIELALVGQDRGPEAERAVLVELQELEPLDGFLVPRQLLVYEIDPTLEPRRFGELPTLDLYRKGGTLLPSLAPEDFLP